MTLDPMTPPRKTKKRNDTLTLTDGNGGALAITLSDLAGAISNLPPTQRRYVLQDLAVSERIDAMSRDDLLALVMALSPAVRRKAVKDAGMDA